MSTPLGAPGALGARLSSVMVRTSADGRLRLWSWLPHVLVALLALPFILSQNSWYEWTDTLWLLELQTAHVAAHGLPTFFSDAAGMYFYPQQLFYAGPTLAVLAYPALLFGPWPVFAAMTAVAFGAASAGISWTARNLGVPGRWSIVPGVLFAATPYTVSNLYGRGDWAELVAVAALAVALGAATSLLTGRARSEPGVVAILALAVAAVAGTHNLTLLLGALLAPLLAVALAPLVTVPAAVRLRRHAVVVAGGVTGVALCGAFLIPNVWLANRTLIANLSYIFLSKLRGFDRPGVIFDPLPGQPPHNAGTDLHTQTLVVALAWCLGCGAWAVGRRRLPRRTAMSLAALGLTALGITLLITSPGWWLDFPKALTSVQFPFRLVSYLALVTALGVAVLLSASAIRRSRVAVGVLAVATCWQLGIAADLALSARALGATPAPTPAAIRASVTPVAYGPGQQIGYRMEAAHPLPVPLQQARITPIGNDTPSVLHVFGSQAAGSLVATEIVASPLIHVTGDVSVAGATAGGFVVLHVDRSPWRASVTSVCSTCVRALAGDAPLPLLAGRAATVLGAVVLVALLGAAWRRRSPPDAVTMIAA